ncbi:MAG: small multi-drug export protein [Candidatus Thermoplasmatota archaeon]|nr:small multi-drug export protein [Candidatus Thermoplasmatota archaeon]
MSVKEASNILIRLAKFLVPVIMGLGVLAFIGLLMNETMRMQYWPLMTGYFFPPLGKESIIPAGVLVAGIHPLVMALSIAFIDIIIALFLIWNYDLAKKIPFVGTFMNKVEQKGKNVEQKYGWVKPLRFIGIALFVMIPFQGSGGLVGSIVGRLIGMKPWNTLLAISIGAIVGCTLIAFFAQAFLIFAEINTMLTVALVTIIALIVLVYFLFKRRKKNSATR